MSNLIQTGVIILAAGDSSRLGQAKQLVEFNGKTLLQHTIDIVSEFSFASKLLILGGNETEIIKATDCSKIEVLSNINWKYGMSSSLKKGVEHVEKFYPDVNYAMVLLSDQPFVSKALMEKLLIEQAKTNAKITASKYGDILGVPVIFEKSLFKEIKALEGDQGARKLIAKTLTEVAFVDFEQGVVDVDTPQDLERLKELNQKKVCE